MLDKKVPCSISKAASNLSSLIVNTATVIRDEIQQEIPIEELVVGDMIKLSAGDMLPADALLIETRDFFYPTIKLNR